MIFGVQGKSVLLLTPFFSTSFLNDWHPSNSKPYLALFPRDTNGILCPVNSDSIVASAQLKMQRKFCNRKAEIIPIRSLLARNRKLKIAWSRIAFSRDRNLVR